MSENDIVNTEETLLGLYKSLPPGAKHRDCPTPEHVAGYYIDSLGSLDSASRHLEVVLSGRYIDLVAFPGDSDVLEILKAAQNRVD